MKALGLKDLKTIARGILEQGTEKPRAGYSKLLGETYRKADNGDIIFNNGAVYTPKETARLRGLNRDTIKALHAVKSVFRGSTIEL